MKHASINKVNAATYATEDTMTTTHTPGPMDAIAVGIDALQTLAEHPAFEEAAPEFNLGGVGHNALVALRSARKHAALTDAAPALYAALSEMLAESENDDLNPHRGADTGGMLLARLALAQADGKDRNP